MPAATILVAIGLIGATVVLKPDAATRVSSVVKAPAQSSTAQPSTAQPSATAPVSTPLQRTTDLGPYGQKQTPAATASTATSVAPVATSAPAAQPAPELPFTATKVVWQQSIAEGTPQSGSLVGAVELPNYGRHYVVLEAPRPAQFGTDDTVRFLLRTTAVWHKRHPELARLVIGDLSLRPGGPVDGHISHQNGRDAEVYWPRSDRAETPPGSWADVDQARALELVQLLVKAGAELVSVPPDIPALDLPGNRVQTAPGQELFVHVRVRSR